MAYALEVLNREAPSVAIPSRPQINQRPGVPRVGGRFFNEGDFEMQQQNKKALSAHSSTPDFKGELLALAFKLLALLCTVILFVAVALATWQLGIFVHWLAAQGVSSLVIWMLKTAEVTLTFLDLAGLVYSTWKHLKH